MSSNKHQKPLIELDSPLRLSKGGRPGVIGMDRWAVQIDANQIVYVEAYGMATVVGDLREIMALTEVRT